MEKAIFEQAGADFFSRIKETIKKRKEREELLRMEEEFKQDLIRARDDLKRARNNYNFATEGPLLEYYIYEIKAAETRLNYFVKLAKDARINNENFWQNSVLKRGGESV